MHKDAPTTETNTEPSRLIIRFTDENDQTAVRNFYARNTHQHVDIRQDAVWNERTRNGRVMIVEDEQRSMGFATVAYDFHAVPETPKTPSLMTKVKNALRATFASHAGGTDQNENAPANTKARWVELGSTTVLQDEQESAYSMIKGLNLYPLMIASQTVYEFLVNTPDDKVLANVYEDNGAVIHMLNNKVGWHFFEPEDAILKACSDTKVKDGHHTAGRKWLHATTDTLPHQARFILKTIEDGTTNGLLNKKTQKHIRLNTDQFSLVNTYKRALQALAHGPLADTLENSVHIGMKNAHVLLECQLKEAIVDMKEQPTVINNESPSICPL